MPRSQVDRYRVPGLSDTNVLRLDPKKVVLTNIIGPSVASQHTAGLR
jgi:hypothetical protein